MHRAVPILITLILFTPAIYVVAERSDVVVKGYVYIEDQKVYNALVIITNMNTSTSNSTYTNSSTGLYSLTIPADVGDVLRITVISFSGENTTTVTNTTRPVWLNITIQSSTATLFRHPVGIAGYVMYSPGNPVNGASVFVTNVNTGETKTTTTNSNGLYVTTLGAADGDTIKVVAMLGESMTSDIKQINLTRTTQWINLTMGHLLADFKAEPSTVKVNEPVFFKDRTVGNPVSWLWSFGDGTSSSQRNPTHTYKKEGTYTVTLKVMDASGKTSQTAGIVRVLSTKNPHIPTPEKPTYPKGYTIKQMCELLRIDKITKSPNKVTIVYIDTGCAYRTFNVEGHLIDLSKIERVSAYKFYSPEDRYGHGTAVASILLYILETKVDNYRIISIKAFNDKGETSIDIFLMAMDMAKMFKPDIVSISAGAYPTKNDPLVRKAEELVKSGIVVVASAGNVGQTGSILSPAIAPDVIAVGAEDPRQTITNLRDDVLCRWSSKGYPGQNKPDVVAPGESIRLPWGRTEEHVLSGTSFSAPLVAGGIAIMISKNKQLYDFAKTLYFWDKKIVVNAVKDALEESCYIKGKRNEWGAGIPIFSVAVERLHWKLFLLLLFPIMVIVVVVASASIFITLRRRKWWQTSF